MANIRFRKSYKIAPGVKLNVGKKSAGVSFGGKLFRQSFSTSGRKTTSSSIPGTGVTFMNTENTKKKKRTKKQSTNRESYKEATVPEVPIEENESANFNDEMHTNDKSRKIKLWPWVLMAVILCGVLGLLFSNFEPEMVEEAPSSVTTQSTTTTQFTYSPDEVSLKLYNGALTAFVGERMVPYSGVAKAGDTSYVVKDGLVDAGYTGVYDDNGTLKLVKDGKVDTESTGVVGAGNGDWYYADNGVVATGKTGIESNEYGSWYVKDGKVQLDQNGLVNANGEEAILTGGKVDTSQNGVIGANGDWVYAEKGIVQTTYTGVKKNEYGRWYVNNGHVDFDYNGNVSSDGSTYLIKDGKVDTSQNGVMKVGDKWAYVVDGMINTNYTGVKSNEYGTWYIKKGFVDFDYEGTVSAPDGYRYTVKDGHANRVTTTRAVTAAAKSGGSNSSYNSGGGGSYVASVNSNVFHYSWCSAAKNINTGNRIPFASRSEAVASGRRPCKICTP